MGCAHSDEWTREDTAMYVVSSAVIAVDGVLTNRIQDCYTCSATGPITGRILSDKPSTNETIVYFGSVIVTNYFIGRALPAKWRKYWYTWELSVHGYSVYDHCNANLC
jgi:hypothetical protein